MKTPIILIADDEEFVRKNIRNYLQRRIECKILEAQNGEEAIKYLKKNPCDALILDIRMPKKSGLHVLDEMKLMRIKVDTIVITSWDSDLVTNECVRREVEIIPKPFRISELYNKLTRLLKKRSLLFLKKKRT